MCSLCYIHLNIEPNYCIAISESFTQHYIVAKYPAK